MQNVPATNTAEQPLQSLSRALWGQRRVLESLLFRLTAQQLILASGESRWVEHASTEVDRGLSSLRAADIERAVHAAAASDALGISPDSTLAEISAAANDPWADILSDHHTALLSMIADMEELTSTNRELITRGLNDTRSFLAALGAAEEAEGYSRTGEKTAAKSAPTRFDWNA